MIALVEGGYWFIIFLLIHIYALYPVSLIVLSLAIDKDKKSRWGTDELPSVSLIIAAYNEEEVIAEKIENALSCDYPDEKFEIIVFSDASSDDTDQIVRSYENQGVRLERIEGRVGKTACQNEVVKQVNSDIIVFSDADSMYESSAVRRLVERFGPDTGCVVGELCYDRYNVDAESAYRKFEKLIKRYEPQVSSIVGGNGAIYAVERSSYVPLPPDQISDFAEPLAIVRNGKRAEYTPEARAWENTGKTVGAEMSRRIRIATRSWHTLLNYTSLFNPVRYPLFSFQLISHTVLRWLSPVLLFAALILNVVIALFANNIIYKILLFSQGVFYIAAAIGGFLMRFDKPVPKYFYVPYYFVVLNYSLTVALWNVIHSRNIITWETESRTENSD